MGQKGIIHVPYVLVQFTPSFLGDLGVPLDQEKLLGRIVSIDEPTFLRKAREQGVAIERPYLGILPKLGTFVIPFENGEIKNGGLFSLLDEKNYPVESWLKRCIQGVDIQSPIKGIIEFSYNLMLTGPMEELQKDPNYKVDYYYWPQPGERIIQADEFRI